MKAGENIDKEIKQYLTNQLLLAATKNNEGGYKSAFKNLDNLKKSFKDYESRINDAIGKLKNMGQDVDLKPRKKDKEVVDPLRQNIMNLGKSEKFLAAITA